MGDWLKRIGSWKDSIATLQGFVLSLAIVSAGGWTIYTRQGEKFWEEVNELKRKNREQGVLDLRIETSNDSPSSGSFRILRITVVAENKGNRNMLIRFEATPPITAAKVQFPETGSNLNFEPAEFGWFYGGRKPGLRLTKHLIRVAEVYRYTTAVRLKSPGLYLISFEAEVNEQDSRPVIVELGAPIGQIHWGASTFVNVD